MSVGLSRHQWWGIFNTEGIVFIEGRLDDVGKVGVYAGYRQVATSDSAMSYIYPLIFSSIKAVTIEKTACQNNLQKTSDSYNRQYIGS